MREVSPVHAPTAWSALCRDGVWLSQVHVDLRSAPTATNSSLQIPPDISPAAVQAFVGAHFKPLCWISRNYLKACRSKPFGAQVIAHDQQGFAPERSIQPEAGLCVPARWECTCDICGKLFPNERTCAVHKARAHGEATLITQLATGTRCRVCGLDVWENHRLRAR